ncbi:hypothetical protein [Pseudonocardia hydrocarbonoxydans]|uniref:Uncharacterized protein n=1 Tax=Pseudonocardia hydrocarbonoxydans TaxID=76726 RepID=A0A4Y3WRU5_9PSEU|nr:hypothetical protein [Pseudonocardia hydrocarbonoxydans]GEC21001.1 hypothetical protein PHY01_32840 [Pseudonocardia hydrocarbonoxydans]
MTDEARVVRARLGAASRKYGPDHEITRVLREKWNAERWLSAMTEALGAQRPPLDDEQQTRLDEIVRMAGLCR